MKLMLLIQLLLIELLLNQNLQLLKCLKLVLRFLQKHKRDQLKQLKVILCQQSKVFKNSKKKEENLIHRPPRKLMITAKHLKSMLLEKKCHLLSLLMIHPEIVLCKIHQLPQLISTAKSLIG